MSLPVFRAVFVSDVHLGFRLSREKQFADWLGQLQTEQLYLNGDIFDGWRLKRNFGWNHDRTRIVNRLLEMVRRGMRLCVLPGNHDDFLRQPVPRLIDGELADEFVHECLNGRRLLVTHGDLFDPVERRGRTISRLGSTLFDAAVVVVPRSFAHGLKRTSKSLFGRPARLTGKIAHAARDRGLSGIVFGHVHKPMLECDKGEFMIANCGDWVEHASFLAETHQGQFCLYDEGQLLATFPTKLTED